MHILGFYYFQPKLVDAGISNCSCLFVKIEALWLVDATQSGYITGALIGQNQLKCCNSISFGQLKKLSKKEAREFQLFSHGLDSK